MMPDEDTLRALEELADEILNRAIDLKGYVQALQKVERRADGRDRT